MAKASKVAVLGIDAMDPRLTRKYVDMGIMPNTKKIIEAGSCRHDLMLLGSMPTVTPPQWTTLATGAHPQTHGITAGTCFDNFFGVWHDTHINIFSCQTWVHCVDT